MLGGSKPGVAGNPAVPCVALSGDIGSSPGASRPAATNAHPRARCLLARHERIGHNCLEYVSSLPVRELGEEIE